MKQKGTVTRQAIRMATGQLADYERLVEPTPTRAVLVPERPRSDLLELASTQGLSVVGRTGLGFRLGQDEVSQRSDLGEREATSRFPQTVWLPGPAQS
jgi:hypothetical protein